jgi:hypothetical protein
MVVTFNMQALVMLLLPFIANIGGSTAYWLCFALLNAYGLFSGIC